MNNSRLEYDDYIPVSELKIGDLLHLTFMGGDEYVAVQNIIVDNDNITWKASYYAELTDTIKSNSMIWIKKRKI